MTDPVEQVLAIPTRVLHDAGLFHGLTLDVAHYAPRLLAAEHFRFLPRPQAELDPTHKQLIPYVVLCYRDQVFHYQRGKGTGEKRLLALRSVGVGGHINPIDAQPGQDPYRQAMQRELEEEVELSTSYDEECLGFINDDRTPVGQVHLGIVHRFTLHEPTVQRRDPTHAEAGFAAVRDLWTRRDEFETWSQFVLEELVRIE